MDHTTFTIANPLAGTIRESEEIIARIDDTATELEAAIANERLWHGHYRDALDNYEMAETEELYEVIILATGKEGPLGGLATSSKAYEIALNNLKNGLRRGKLSDLWQAVDRLKRSYEMAQVELQQVETRFKALRTIAEIKAQVLRASLI